MEFKGTNETWFRSGTEIVSMPSQVKIAKVSGRTYEEAIANSKLIENSKEMLEMLKSFVDSCCGEQECEEELIKGLGHELYNNVLKAKQLIKQATEIDPKNQV